MRAEFALIERYFRRRFAATATALVARGDESGEDDPFAAPASIVGIGDDAALWRNRQAVQVASVDTQVLGRHWFAGCPPAVVAWRALAAATSDLAAMGAQPSGFLLALTLPDARRPDPVWTPDRQSEPSHREASAVAARRRVAAGTASPWLEGFAEGLWQAATAFGIPLIGGDTTRGPLAVSITVLGERPEHVAGPAGVALTPGLRRSDARPGDRLWVGGALGAAALGLQRIARERALQSLARTPVDTPAAIARWCWPRPRIALGRQLLQRSGRVSGGVPQGRVGAAIDLSDGLIADALHLARQSDVVVAIDLERVPVATPATRPFAPTDRATAASECHARRPDEQAEVRAWLAALTGGEDYELLWTAEAGFDASSLPSWDDDLAPLRDPSRETDTSQSPVRAWRATPGSAPEPDTDSAAWTGVVATAAPDRCGPSCIGQVAAPSSDGPGVELRYHGRPLAFWAAADEAFRRRPDGPLDPRLQALLGGLVGVGFDHFA